MSQGWKRVIWLGVAALLGPLLFSLGWLVGDVTNDPKPVGNHADREGRSLIRPTKRPRVPRLTALGLSVTIEEIEKFSSAEVARLGAKKWTEELALAQKISTIAGEEQHMGLDEYFAGWLSVVQETKPYDRDQFVSGLRAELCNDRPGEWRLLQRMTQQLSDLAVPDCLD